MPGGWMPVSLVLFVTGGIARAGGLLIEITRPAAPYQQVRVPNLH